MYGFSRKLSAHRKVLLKFVQEDEGWAENRVGWDSVTDVHECEWDGIVCDTNNEIIEINIESSGLSSTIPDSIHEIKTLERILLSDNKIYGIIPYKSLSKLQYLKEIDLSSNLLRGPLEHLDTPTIEILNFSYNQLSGDLPPGIPHSEKNKGGEEKALRIYDISNNRLGGTIDAKNILHFGESLVELDLSNNKFGGLVPDVFDQLHNLEGLFLSNNNLLGPIPPSLTTNVQTNLPKLSQIYLHGNRLSGTVPQGLSDLPRLTILFLDDNRLTGEIPQALCDKNLNDIFFSSSSKLNINPALDSDIDDDRVDDNAYTEFDKKALDDDSSTQTKAYDDDVYQTHAIPPPPNRHRRHNKRRTSSADTKLIPPSEPLQHEYHENIQTNGSITRLSTSSSPSQITQSVERNGCNSIACPAGTRSARVGDKDGIFPCVPCEHNFLNPYLGSNKCYELEYEKILAHFYYSTDGENWNSSSPKNSDKTHPRSWIDDEVHVCEKTGIRCNDEGRISEIHLSGMNLSGTISEDLGFLRDLKVLDLSNNHLYGQVPSELQWAPLEYLDLTGNRLEGVIPPELCEKKGLNNVDLDSNIDATEMCEHIACPAGTYNENIGRRDDTLNEFCLPCESSSSEDVIFFLGSVSCSPHQNIHQNEYSMTTIMIMVLFALLVTGALVLLIITKNIIGVFAGSKGDYEGIQYNHDMAPGSDLGGSETSSSNKILYDDPHNNRAADGDGSNDLLGDGTFVSDHTIDGSTNIFDLDMNNSEWDERKETPKEVWLDVPRIH